MRIIPSLGTGGQAYPQVHPAPPISRQFSAAAAIYETIDLRRLRRRDKDPDNKFSDPASAPLMPSVLGLLSVHFDHLYRNFGIKKVSVIRNNSWNLLN